MAEFTVVPTIITDAMCKPMHQAMRDFIEGDSRTFDIEAIWTDTLALAPPTTQSEAVASARAEGVREGLERAAGLFDSKVSDLSKEIQTGLGPNGEPTVRAAIYARQDRFAAQCNRDAIRALIAAPPTTPGGRTDG